MSRERKSSGNFQKADIDNFHNHNFRITKPSYLLPNEFVTQKNHTVLFHDFNEIFDEQLKIWKSKNKKGGRPPQKANCLQEIVINLKADSKIDDLKTIANYIQKQYGYIPLEIAIHNDEGFVDKEGKPHYNYHAHIAFCTLNDGIQWCQMEKYCDKVEYTKKDGTKSWRFVSNKDSKLQDFIAATLGMERGQKGSKAKRLEHEQYRQVAQQKQVLNDKIDDLDSDLTVYKNILDIYIESFEIKSNGMQMITDIYGKADELKTLRTEKETQLKQIELLKTKRGVLNKGAKSYRQQKKALKAEITKLNSDITDLNKTIQSLQADKATLTADKADLQTKLDKAKEQILSDEQKTDLITKAINDFIEQGQLYTKQAYDSKVVTKTQTVTKLRDYSEQEKQTLIDNAINAKIASGDLYTKEQYNNKPLTQRAIKDYIEQNRQAMRQQGIYTASDYKQLSQLKADLISELKLTKAGELQLTEEQVISRIKTLMTNLTAAKTKAETDLETVKADLVTENLKNKYNELLSHSQKSSITPQKRSQSDEMTIKRVEVPQTSQSQSMSVLEQNTTIDKKYRIMLGDNECFMTAQDIKEWLEDYPDDREFIAKQLSESDRREVLGEPKQTPSRVRHGFSR